MNGYRTPQFRAARQSLRMQHGATLLVVLVLLLVMTLLGLASLRGTVLEERMSSNLLDRSLSFQVAEGALREAEIALSAGPDFPNAGCDAQGLCARPDPSQPERWLDNNFTAWRTASVVDGSVDAPQYIIEAMGTGPNWPFCDSEIPPNPNCLKPRYRITARSASAGRASVTLQTTYAGQ